MADPTRRLTGVAFGRRVALEVPASLLAELTGRLPFGWQPAEGPYERMWEVRAWGEGVWAAANDDGFLVHLSSPHDALDLLIGDLELWVAEHAVGLVFVHAGCVAWRGRAVVVPGRTHAGKSTLVAALVSAGATYYSDEYTVLGADGLVRPYARELSIRPPGGGESRRVPVAELGGTAGEQPVPIGLVAHLRYDAAGWAVEPLSRARIALALLENTVPALTRPVEVMDHLQAATGLCAGLTGTRGGAAEAAARLLTAVDAASAR